MESRQANQYVVVGNGVDGTIEASSVGGMPSVSIRVDDKVLVSPEYRDTELGVEVTGVIERVPDSHTVHLRLVVPRIIVAAEPVPFAGVALLTTACTPFSPSLPTGSVHRYEIRPVGGRADAVES
jgi:hypothetical protein